MIHYNDINDFLGFKYFPCILLEYQLLKQGLHIYGKT